VASLFTTQYNTQHTQGHPLPTRFSYCFLQHNKYRIFPIDGIKLLVFIVVIDFVVCEVGTSMVILIVVLPCMLTITKLLLQQNAHFYY
jgi:hypothetical protein